MLLPESLLNRMELPILLQSLDGGDLTPIRLDRKKSAGLDRLPIQVHRASAAVGGIAADMSPGQAEHVADAVDEQKPRLDIGFHIAAVHLDANLLLRHRYFPPRLRSKARLSARTVNTRTRSRLYSSDPRRSAVGADSSAASSAARLIDSPSIFFPRKAASAFSALTGVRPTLVSPIPTRSQTSSLPTVNCAATPAVAKSPTLRSNLK